MDYSKLKIPTHVAFIVDGNGRWATEKGKIRSEGHKQGFLKPKIRYFKVIGAGDDLSKLPSPIEVPETYLYPEGMSVIRFPSEFPVINNMDIRALEIIISYLPQSNFVDNADAKKSVYARLNALLDKLKFYSKLDEV